MRSLVLVAALLLATACGSADGSAESSAPVEPGWDRVADAPLSARYGPLLAWTGAEVLVLGGHTERPCPPNADCVMPEDNPGDGAAYDPDTDEWRPLADPPVDVDRYTGHVVVDGDLVVGVENGWWRFDPGSDAWTRLPDPGRKVGAPEAERDGRVYSHVGDLVHILDLASGAWSALPADPLSPPLTDGAVFATGSGVVLSGVNYEESAPDEPTLTQADLWDGTSWHRLPRSEMIGPLYHWTGERIVGLELNWADGGEVNGWDRSYPYAGALDPAAEQWSEIDGVPSVEEASGERNWRVEAAAGPLVATWGFAYDDRTAAWEPLGRPDSDLDWELTGVWADNRLVVVGGADRDGYLVPEVWVRTISVPIT